MAAKLGHKEIYLLPLELFLRQLDSSYPNLRVLRSPQNYELDYEENASYEDSQEPNISPPPSVDRDEDQNKEEIGGEVELGETTDAQSSFGRKYQKKH